MSQRIVSIDISSHVARVVVLEMTLRRTEVMAVHEIPIVAGSSRKQILSALRAVLPSRIDSTVIAANVGVVSARSLSFPFGDLRRVDSAVIFELEGVVPYDLEETAATWHVVAHHKDRTDVLAALTPKSELVALVGDAEQAGFEPRAIVPPASALAELVPSESSDVVAIAALGAETTHLAVVRGQELLQTRSLRVGGDDVDRALAAAFKVNIEAAKLAKEQDVRIISRAATVADPEARRVSDVTVLGLAPLIAALMTSFAALPKESAPTRLLITGGLSRLPGLTELLGQRLGLEVMLLDTGLATAAVNVTPAVELMERLFARWHRKTPQETQSTGPVPQRAVPPEFAVALGMAIGVARHGPAAPLNFRRGEFAYQGDLQLYRGQMTRIAIGVASVILLAIIGAVVRYSMLAADEQRINAGFCAATKKIVGREICDPTAALATMRQSPGTSDGVVIPSHSAATLLEMMSKGIGQDIDVTFDDLEFRVDGRTSEPDRITGKGEAASFESTEQLAESLRRDACVQDVDVGKQRKTRDGNRVEFNLTVKVACPAGVRPGSRQNKPHAEVAGTESGTQMPKAREENNDE